MEEPNTIYLKQLSDRENVLLMKLSYLDFDVEKYEEMKLDGFPVTVADLVEILTNPDKSYLGIPDDKMSKCVGSKKISTQAEVIQELNDSGLGGLVVTDIAYDPQSGFKGIAFEDSYNNRGISYSATNFEEISKDTDENLLNYLKESDEQIEAAKIFFKLNKQRSAKNYLYGHSLGGNLVSHVYLDNCNEINTANVVNGVRIDKELIDTEKKIRAMSDGDKYNSNIIGGDPASQLKDYGSHEYNIVAVENNKELPNTLLGNHLLEAATYDIDGDFEYMLKEEAYRGRRYKNKEAPIIIEEYTLEDFKKDVSKAVKGRVDKIVQFGQDTWGKLKAFGRKILSSNTKLLTDGIQTRKKEEDSIEQQNNEDTVLSFRERQQLKNYINDMYTMEDAIKAQEVSDNPLEFMDKKEATEEKTEKDRDNSSEDAMRFYN